MLQDQDLNHIEGDLSSSVLTVSRSQDHSSQYDMVNCILIWEETGQSEDQNNRIQ